MTSLLGRTVALVVLTALLTSPAACSTGSEKSAQGTDEDARQVPAPHETTAAPERGTVAVGETKAKTSSRAAWDYVALGDSLAAGVGARRGYVDRFAEHLRNDTGVRIRVVSLGRSGQTSSQLLYAVRNDAAMRRFIGGAEVVTFNIGINDLGHAGRAYESGTCGGAHNEACLHKAVEEVEENWDAIIDEMLGLRSTDEAIIRTAGLGYTPRVDGVFEPYLAEVNRHIAASATDNGIPYAEVHLGERGTSPDGVQPNDEGYRAIAERLQELGYEPLGPR